MRSGDNGQAKRQSGREPGTLQNSVSPDAEVCSNPLVDPSPETLEEARQWLIQRLAERAVQMTREDNVDDS